MQDKAVKELFKPAKTQRASEIIYNQFYQKIISGELSPGDRLPPEKELAELFQRSRPIVREALRMLQQDGLIEISVGNTGGSIVKGMSVKTVEEPLEKLLASGVVSIREILEYRYINDRGCARLAAIHHTEEDAVKLQQILEDARNCVGDPQKFRECDIAFHNALADASHNTLAVLNNRVIVKLIVDTYTVATADYTMEQHKESNLKVYETHYAIMEAVLEREPEKAEACVSVIVDMFKEAVWKEKM